MPLKNQTIFALPGESLLEDLADYHDDGNGEEESEDLGDQIDKDHQDEAPPATLLAAPINVGAENRHDERQNGEDRHESKISQAKKLPENPKMSVCYEKDDDSGERDGRQEKESDHPPVIPLLERLKFALIRIPVLRGLIGIRFPAHLRRDVARPCFLWSKTTGFRRRREGQGSPCRSCRREHLQTSCHLWPTRCRRSRRWWRRS